MHRVSFCFLGSLDYLSINILEHSCSEGFEKVTVFLIEPEPWNFKLPEEGIKPNFPGRFLKFTIWVIFVKHNQDFLGQGNFLKTRAFR